MRNIFKRVVIASMIAFMGCLSVSAQSVVYIFLDKCGSGIPIKINGVDIFEMKSSNFKRTHLPMEDNVWKEDPNRYIDVYDPCVKKCILNREGKTVISFDFKYINHANGSTNNMAAEIQLNLSEGSVHYIKICRKGFSDVQIKEIKEKEANKKLKKWEKLPDYIEN